MTKTTSFVEPYPCRLFLIATLALSNIPLLTLGDSPELAINKNNFTLSQTQRDQAQERIAADVRFLAADDMRGRGPGTGGLDRAADFIAQRWQSFSLDTTLFQGTPFQIFTIPGAVDTSKPEKNRLKIVFDETQTEELQLDHDFRPMSLGANRRFEGSLAFVGYGITSNDDRLHTMTTRDWMYVAKLS